MSRRLPQFTGSPISAWFQASNRPPPALRYELPMALPGGLLKLRTNSAAFFDYARKRGRHLPAQRQDRADATADIYWLEDNRWPLIRPPHTSIHHEQVEGPYQSLQTPQTICAWQTPTIMGCAERGRTTGIQIVATAIDPVAAQPAGPFRCKGKERYMPFPEAWDMALCLFARTRGIAILHGAVLAAGERGLLLIGASGSGKTTAALALVRDGCRLLTDEYAVLWNQGPLRGRFGGVLVPPMLAQGTPRALADLEDTLGAVSNNKSGRSLPARQTRRDPVDIAVILSLVRPQRRLPTHRARRMDTFELVRHLMSQLLDPVHGDRKSTWETMLTVAENTPAYRVTVGTHLASWSAFVERLSTQARRTRRTS